MKSENKTVCSFCDKPINTTHQGGEWHTSNGGVIFCCHRCATDVIPLLMADSVHIEIGYVEGIIALEKATGSFWKGLAARISRGGMS